jgi:hypothetical protein
MWRSGALVPVLLVLAGCGRETPPPSPLELALEKYVDVAHRRVAALEEGDTEEARSVDAVMTELKERLRGEWDVDEAGIEGACERFGLYLPMEASELRAFEQRDVYALVESLAALLQRRRLAELEGEEVAVEALTYRIFALEADLEGLMRETLREDWEVEQEARHEARAQEERGWRDW